MLFNSHVFIFAFLPVAVTGWWMLRRQDARLIWLTLMSYLFYAYWDWRFVSLMLVSTVIDYTAGLGISRSDVPSVRKRWLVASLVANLGLLGFFKYSGFFLASVAAVCRAAGLDWAVPTLSIILPAGISFYTFQSMSYTIDLYRGIVQPAKSFLHFALYVSMYPQLIAGPIVRYSYIEDQLAELKQRLPAIDLWRGIYFFVWGLSLKVLVADTVASYSDRFLSAHETIAFPTSWLAMLGYAYQILFDFDGYSCMAVGLAFMLGFRMPQNFDSPYKAANPSDFWRRWHITLSEWLRDYLYFALGGSRHGLGTTVRNLFLTMFLGGLWHGAGWTFVAWGIFHGALLGGYHALRSVNLWPGSRAIGRAITFTGVLFSWVLFRSDDFGMVGNVLSGMFGLHGLESEHIHLRFYGMLALCFVWTNWGPNAWDLRMTPRRLTAFALALAFVVSVLMLAKPSPFLCFRF